MISKIKKNRNGKVEMKTIDVHFKISMYFILKFKDKIPKRIINVGNSIIFDNRKKPKNGLKMVTLYRVTNTY